MIALFLGVTAFILWICRDEVTELVAVLLSVSWAQLWRSYRRFVGAEPKTRIGRYTSIIWKA